MTNREINPFSLCLCVPSPSLDFLQLNACLVLVFHQFTFMYLDFVEFIFKLLRSITFESDWMHKYFSLLNTRFIYFKRNRRQPGRLVTPDASSKTQADAADSTERSQVKFIWNGKFSADHSLSKIVQVAINYYRFIAALNPRKPMPSICLYVGCLHHW